MAASVARARGPPRLGCSRPTSRPPAPHDRSADGEAHAEPLDTGPGIAPPDFERIFEPFERVAPNHSQVVNAFHRWFGVVIAKSPPFGVQFATDLVLSELTEHIEEEIKGDHHGMCKTFLRGLGVADPAAIQPISLTDKYIDSFRAIYMTDSSSFEEALSALAGRELCAPERNRIIIDALSSKYGIAQGLDFLHLHEELELDHFKRLWEALTNCRPKSTEPLVNAAKSEITRHIRFWDDVSHALTEQG